MYGLQASQARALGDLLGDLNSAFTKPRYEEQRDRAFKKMQLKSYYFFCVNCKDTTPHKLTDNELYMCEDCGNTLTPQIEE